MPSDELPIHDFLYGNRLDGKPHRSLHCTVRKLSQRSTPPTNVVPTALSWFCLPNGIC